MSHPQYILWDKGPVPLSQRPPCFPGLLAQIGTAHQAVPICASKSISGVLYSIIIYLGCQLPDTSSDLTRERGGQPQCSSIRSCSRWGLPSQTVTCLLVSSCLTVPPLPENEDRSRRFISVALSLGSPPLDVIQHPALWSSDFPQVSLDTRDYLIYLRS